MSKTKKTKLKRRIFTPLRLFILLLIAVVLIMGVWLGLRTAIVKGMTIGMRNMEAEGYQIAHGGLSVSGFPLSINAASRDIAIQAPAGDADDLSKNWSVKLSDLDFGTATVTPLSWQLRHRGTMRVDMRGAGGERYMFDIAPAKVDARGAITFKGKLKSAQIDIGKTTLSPLVGTPPIILGAQDAHIDVKVSGSNAHLDINAHDVVLSDKAMGLMDEILGTHLSEVSLTMTIKNWADLEENGPESWMENGGGFTSDDWIIHWGKVDFVGDFDVHFKNGLPEGIIHVSIKGAPELLDTIIASGYLSQFEQQARMFASSLKIGEDGRSLLNFPIRNGVMKYGFIEIYDFKKN